MGRRLRFGLVLAVIGCAQQEPATPGQPRSPAAQQAPAQPPLPVPPAATEVSTTEPRWEGEYTYSESCGRTAGGTGVVLGHGLRIYRRGDQLFADYGSDGWMTMTRIDAIAEPLGDGLGIYFLANRPDGMALDFKQNDLMFVVRAAPNGVMTYWKELKSGCSEDGVVFARTEPKQ